jgi:hypothetical protein
MDLSQPLGIQRDERRAVCSSEAVLKFAQEAGTWTVEVVNWSDSGLCVRFDRPPAVAEVFNVESHLPLPSDRVLVRWTRPDAGGGHLAGMSCC